MCNDCCTYICRLGLPPASAAGTGCLIWKAALESWGELGRASEAIRRLGKTLFEEADLQGWDYLPWLEYSVYSEDPEKTEWRAVLNLPQLCVKLKTDKRVFT